MTQVLFNQMPRPITLPDVSNITDKFEEILKKEVFKDALQEVGKGNYDRAIDILTNELSDLDDPVVLYLQKVFLQLVNHLKDSDNWR